MAHFVCSFEMIEAIQFDGTRASARAAVLAFPKRVAFDAEGDLLALSVDPLGRVLLAPVPKGSWLTERRNYLGPVEIIPDATFRCRHQPYPKSPA